jgi:Transposase DDE domain
VPDPTVLASPAQFRGLFRSLVLDPALLLARALDPGDLARIAAEEAGPTRESLFTPETTAVFLSQVGSDDHSCRSAVARLLAWRVARGLPPCSPDAGGYCKARHRLPESLLPRLTRHVADRVGEDAPRSWAFHGRRVVIADGSGVSMPDTPENRAEYPQHWGQRPGCGFPLARIVVLICLATGCVIDAAIGASRGKQTGEMALIRGLHGRLRRGDILLADAYYSSFDEVASLAGLGVDVVMRRHGGRPTSAAASGWVARTTWSPGGGAATDRAGWDARSSRRRPVCTRCASCGCAPAGRGSGRGRSWWSPRCSTRRPSPPRSWPRSTAGGGIESWTSAH